MMIPEFPEYTFSQLYQAYEDAFTAADDFYERVKNWADQFNGTVKLTYNIYQHDLHI
jgi:hypothetical protein